MTKNIDPEKIVREIKRKTRRQMAQYDKAKLGASKNGVHGLYKYTAFLLQ